MSLGNLITEGGQAIQDLFQNRGASAEANSYSSAALLAEQNAQLASASTKIQETQLARQIFQSEGTQITDVAGAGFTESGSALDLLRSSAQQGSLAKSLTNIQGAINENSYAAQAGAYEGAAKAAGENATANTIGAIASIGGALVNNTGALVSAGKTVVQGISSIFGGGEALSFAPGAAAASNAATTAAFLNPEGTVDFASQFSGSALDQAIAGGSDLSENLAASSISLDTSGLSIGTDAAAAESGIGSVFSELTDSVGSALSDVSSSLGLDGLGESLGLDGLLGPAGLLFTVGSFIPGVSDVLNTVTDAVGSVVSDVADGIGSVFGSVICTEYYKQGYISRSTWLGDQRYGNKCNKTIQRGYYLWGKPLARKFSRYPRLARLLFPILRPAIYEMAAKEGHGKSTLFGAALLKFFLGVSFTLGCITPKYERTYHAIKT